MPVVIDTPAFARLDGYAAREEEVRELLTYRDQRVAYELRRLMNTPRDRTGLTAAQFSAKIDELKGLVRRSLLFSAGGVLRAPAGLAQLVATEFGDEVVDLVGRPAPSPYAWHKKPAHAPRDFQVAARDRLQQARHGCVELCPGSGKTLLALMLVRDLGLPAVVCSPFSTIARQTFREFTRALGARRVGLFGDGKKDLTKDVTVATVQSLTRVVAGSETERFFREKSVFVFDESHMAPADTLSKVCLGTPAAPGLMAGAPYRFFLSGTQLRTDGLQLLLDGIVGPVQMTLDVQEAVRQGFLAPPRVRILEVRNGRGPKSRDPGAAGREVLFRSDKVAGLIGALANKMVAAGRPVLVMIDELDQFARLLPHLRHEVRFAHGATDKKALERVPEAHRKSDTLDLVDRFNAGEFPILVGTSCVGTGVDVRATGAGFYWRDGKSEIDVRQTAGRFMRLHPGKNDVLIFDIDVMDGEIVHKHAVAREQIWGQLTSDVARVRGLG